MPNNKNIIIIDMVFFQINKSGIARVWESLLKIWANDLFGQNLILLDRNNTAPKIEGLQYVSINEYDYNEMYKDSVYLQSICDKYNASLFISTYYSKPLNTKSLLLIHDMIPEMLDWNLNEPMWISKKDAIEYASEFICVSKNSAKDLLFFYPTLNKKISIAHCGVDAIYKPRSNDDIYNFKLKYNISNPYYLVVGERGSHKNIDLFFNSLADINLNFDFEVVCLGGQPLLENYFSNINIPKKIHLIKVPDIEMSVAYSGALALIYPSLYEGFGLPIIEALSCNCPVITCKRGSIQEISGNNVIYVDIKNAQEMTSALELVQKDYKNSSLHQINFNSLNFKWEDMAATIKNKILERNYLNIDNTAIFNSDELLIKLIEIFKQINLNPYDQSSVNPFVNIRLDILRLLISNITRKSKIFISPSLIECLKLLIDFHSYNIPKNELESELLITLDKYSSINELNKFTTIEILLVDFIYKSPYDLNYPINLHFEIEDIYEVYYSFALTPPPFFTRLGDVELYSKYLFNILSDICKGIDSKSEINFWDNLAIKFINKSSIIPCYFSNSSLQDLMHYRAKILEYIISKYFSNQSLDYNFPNIKRKKYKIGILAAHFLPQTETYATLPVYSNLDKNNYEIILISQKTIGTQPLEIYCSSFADVIVNLTEDLNNDILKIRELNLDVIWVGTNVTAVVNYIAQLAIHRLARLQIIGGCAPITTGFNNIDFFVSGTSTESDNASSYYTEKLYLLDGPAHCFDLNESEFINNNSTTPFNRESIGASDNDILFISGANFFKIIPELLESWFVILNKTPNSKLILYPFNPNWSNAYPITSFLNYLGNQARKYNLSPDRIIISPPLPNRNSIISLIKLADIYLDSFPYSGMTSILDPLQAGIPIVILDGIYQREKMSSSAFKSLNLNHLCSLTKGDYIERAVMLASNKEMRIDNTIVFLASMNSTPKFLDIKWFSKSIEHLISSHFKFSNINLIDDKLSKFLLSLGKFDLENSYPLLFDNNFYGLNKVIVDKLKIISSSYFMQSRGSKLSSLYNLKKLGFNPNVVIDVGAQIGTPELFTVFPDAHHIFIEPVIECIPDLNKIAESLKSCEVINCAISNEVGESVLSLNETKQYSSIDEKIGDVSRIIALKTIDSIMSSRNLTGSFLLKIDVDGPEIKVLEGSTSLLVNHDCIIIIEACIGCEPARFGEIIDYMKTLNYIVFDIIDKLYRPSDWGLWQVDLIFVKINSEFRINNHYS